MRINLTVIIREVQHLPYFLTFLFISGLLLLSVYIYFKMYIFACLYLFRYVVHYIIFYNTFSFMIYHLQILSALMLILLA
ncbi:unnamed protein product [Brugia timori]|uniref:Uncharacterized protein n=1 Tax=Brugia timori TaxID=42155 RepID=A0A0R3Q4Q1_9BILA|nr:unnamed protein product [Brugia timori]